MELTAFIFNVTIATDFADHVIRSIFDRRQLFGITPETGLIARGRHRHRERFMGTLSVVDEAPLIKVMLPLPQGGAVLVAQDFSCQSAMKAFVFALGLGMMRS